MFNTILTGCSQGLIWAILALGVYISFRLLDFADLSCEGCITCGAAVAATSITLGSDPITAIILAFLSGTIAGMLTGFLHTKLKIPPILAGILTMIGLWSVNIVIMSIAKSDANLSTANLSLLTVKDNLLYNAVANLLHIPAEYKIYSSLAIGLLIAAVVVGVLYWFFGTELGSSIRATGANPAMCRAQGINTDAMKIIGLALSNGLIAMSGALLAQYQSYADVSMGVGSIVIGLASIIIGETVFMKAKGFLAKLIGIVVGSIIYRVVVALVIYSGMPSTFLKLLTAVVVALALSIPVIKDKISAIRLRRKCMKERADDE